MTWQKGCGVVAPDVTGKTMLAHLLETTSRQPIRLPKPFATLKLGDYLQMDEIQSHFDGVPLDPYVAAGFRRKSIVRMRAIGSRVARTTHGPLYQPKDYNPVHGGIVREYREMDARLAALLKPVVLIFAACAKLGREHEILVQAQRITASGGDDGATGYPVVEGWHRDNTSVLGILLVNRVNVTGGVSMLARDPGGSSVAFAQTLSAGDLLLVDDTALWHNTTPISKMDSDAPGHRDVVILTWPSCREPSFATRAAGAVHASIG